MSVPLATRKGRWRKYRSTVVARLRLEVAPAEASACQRRTTYCFLRGSKVGSLAILLATRRNKMAFYNIASFFAANCGASATNFTVFHDQIESGLLTPHKRQEE